MIFIILAVGLIASFVEAYFDRHGESQKDKVKDAIFLAAAALCLCLLACYLNHTNPLKVIALFLGVRVLVFDPLVNYFLKKYSEGHKDINMWTYVGTTSKIDRLVSRINPTIRIVIRVILFVGALVLFFYP